MSSTPKLFDLFLEQFYKRYRYITQEFVGLRMQNFEGFVFYINTNREVFRSALVYL